MAGRRKVCRLCNRRLALVRFRAVGNDRRRTECGDCEREATFARDLRRRYDLPLATYEAMLVDQGGCCAICEKTMAPPCVDHCHESGLVRGLLCANCNLGLGHLRDDAALLVAAIGYLAA